MVKEFQSKVLQVAETPLSDDATASKLVATDTVRYEFPTGYRQVPIYLPDLVSFIFYFPSLHFYCVGLWQGAL